MLELLPDPHHNISQVDTAVKLYLAVLRGFLEPPASASAAGASKLRHSLRFKWSHSLLGISAPEVQHDAAFEVANLLVDYALWLMKHAAVVASKEDLKMDDAKEIHSSLRKAAGLVVFVKDTMLPQLVEKPVQGSDLDIRVIAAYLHQCTAEAQEGRYHVLVSAMPIDSYSKVYVLNIYF